MVDDGEMASDVTVTLEMDESTAKATEIDDRIFGEFIEHLAGAIYPGIFADYVTNGCFEVWNYAGPEVSPDILYPDVETYPGLAYPWEPFEISKSVTFEHAQGGVRGRRTEKAIETSDEIPESVASHPAGITEPRYQCVNLEGQGGIQQRLALPDFRELSYDIAISLRSQEISDCEIALRGPDGESLARQLVPLTQDWERHEVRLELEEESDRSFLGSHFGEYTLTIAATSNGSLDLDWATVRPADAVEGKFNPTTIRQLRDFNVPSIRWPGGNFASQYRWRDGVGPVQDRPVVPNLNWGGLEPNYLGTNEWLHFCELTDIEPYITVGYWSEIGPTEAAEWVEYCNGSVNTEMGALRAEHGYSAPWDVSYWEIGNEVWGDSWQVGGAKATSYAEGFKEYYKAMKAVDPGIQIDAVGLNPVAPTLEDGSTERLSVTQRLEWNDALFAAVNEMEIGIDLHPYTRGINDPERRAVWMEEHDCDPIDYDELLVNFPGLYDHILQLIRDRAADHGLEDLRITLGEWNLSPTVDPDWPAPETGTMAHGAYAARMFNTFLRNNAVQAGFWTDYTLYSHPYRNDFRPYPHRFHPPHPGAHVQKVYAEPFSRDASWSVLPVAVNSPTISYPDFELLGAASPSVSVVDAAAIRSMSIDGEVVIVLFVTNGDLRDTHTVSVSIGNNILEIATNGENTARSEMRDETETDREGGVTNNWGKLNFRVTRLSGDGGDPFVTQTDWDASTTLNIEEFESVIDANDQLPLSLPPASVVKIEFKLPS